jgi:hypothetical protein
MGEDGLKESRNRLGGRLEQPDTAAGVIFASIRRVSDLLHTMPDRRYNDDEIAEIFQKASEGPQGASLQRAGDEGGMTLAELKDIGREVGIAPEAVERAAQSLEVRPSAAVRSLLGLPVGVERTIALDRRLSEEEWERLVVELREVFGARGTVSSSGSFRQWTNGNLQALLEPTGNGHRLRITTVKGSAGASMVAGATMLGVGAVMGVSAAVAGQLGQVVPIVSMMSLLGAGMIGSTVLRLPSWARLRGRQMESITTRLALETKSDDSRRLPSS